MVPVLRFSALWAINDDLDPATLVAQLDGFAAAGLGGVVFHPRRYTDRPRYLGDEYLAIVSDLADAAAERGLEFWIYDENGWPSGTVDGRLLEAYPHLRQCWVERWPADEPGHPGVELHVADGWSYRLVEGDGVDYLNAETAERFLELCYQRYADGMRPEAFARVRGFFSDEPELGLGHAQHLLSPHGAIPWTPRLPDAFRARHGRDLLPALAGLFDGAEDARADRVGYWELVTDLFADDYLARLDRWCADRGLVFTAHVKGEEHPLFQVPTSGSLGPVARRVALPGVDALGREPGNDFFPRLVSSVSRQFGSGRAMAEAFGGAGWGASPADLERYLLWLGRNGITDFVLHIAQFRLDSAAIEDWPPSQPLHLSWREVYPRVLAAVAARLDDAPRPAADTLVVVPQRGIQAEFSPRQFVAMNVHDARDYAGTAAGEINGRFLATIAELSARGVAYDLIDERTLENEGRPEGGGVRVGAQRYRHVVVAEGAVLDAATADAVTRGGPPTGRPPRAAPVGGAVIADVEWTLGEHPENELPLAPAATAEGWEAVFVAGAYRGEVDLVFAEPPLGVRADAGLTLLDPREGDAVVRARIDRPGVHRISFAAPGVRRPYAWVRGRFRVDPDAVPRPRGALVEFDAGFRLEPARSAIAAELSADGFPFLFAPLDLRARVTLRHPVASGGFVGGHADAGRIDGRWSWGDEWACGPVDAGVRDFDVRLVPNSLNRYGPLHYFAGDPTVVSPAQMSGERNYADADDAPEQTHVAAWVLRRLRLPSGFAVLSTPTIDNGDADAYSDPGCESIHIPDRITKE